jgi:membrane fusion protein (multidrug efflux system)
MEAGVEAARASQRSAQANLDFANRELDRYRPLVEAGAASSEKMSELIAGRDRSTADEAAAEASFVQAERRVESIDAQAVRLAARVDAARVQRQAAANDLAATRLTAPIAGHVANRTVRAGQYVEPGMRLLTIVPTQDIYVLANFKETQVGLMRAGQPAEIHVDALPGIEFAGVVSSVTAGTGANFSLIPPQNATGNFTKIVQRVPVRIRIDAGLEARRVLVPGLSLDVEVDTRAGRAELDAIRAEQEQARK